MKRKPKIILSMVFLTVVLLVAYDLRPYSVYNYETQTIHLATSHQMISDSFSRVRINLTETLIAPSYQVVRTEIIEISKANVSLLADIPLDAELYYYANSNPSHGPLHNGVLVELSEVYNLGSDLEVYFIAGVNTTVTGIIFINVTYTMDVLFLKPEKFTILSPFMDMLLYDKRILVVVGLIIVTISLMYLSRSITEF